jgi:hypothetical protein
VRQFNPRKVHAVNVRLFGETLLRPTLLGSQVPDALGEGSGCGWRRRETAFRHSEMVVGAAQLLNKL